MLWRGGVVNASFSNEVLDINRGDQHARLAAAGRVSAAPERLSADGLFSAGLNNGAADLNDLSDGVARLEGRQLCVDFDRRLIGLSAIGFAFFAHQHGGGCDQCKSHS